MTNISEHEIFFYFFDDDIRDLIVKEITRYVTQKGNLGCTFRFEDLNTFLVIMLLYEYHYLPIEHIYWSQSDDLDVPIVAKANCKNSFSKVKQYLHFANNEHVDRGDKMTKVEPLLETVNSKLKQFEIFCSNLSIDK